MAKPLGPKSTLIREAITANPNSGNTKLAGLINGSDARKDDKIKVTANDVAQQRQAMKKAGTAPAAKSAGKKRGRRKGKAKAVAPAARVTAPAPKRAAGPVELIDRLFDFAEECGGLGQLKRLVDRIAQAERA
jgi:hypothetical protein